MEQEDVSAWQQVASKSSGKVYWYNVRTGATQWHPPRDAASASTNHAARHRHSGPKRGRTKRGRRKVWSYLSL